MRSIIVFLALLAFAYGKTETVSTLPLFLYDKLPELYRGFIPERVREFYTHLTDDEKLLIVEFATLTGDFVSKTDDDAWTLLKTKNFKLYEKAFEIHTWFIHLFEKITPNGRVFIDYIFSRLRIVYLNNDKDHLVENAKLIIDQFKLLNTDTKLTLKEYFLWVYEYVQNTIFEDLASGNIHFD